ncbi:hypothetical protein BLOT_004891 [Blomia tropicalis]|nr:hypothetical protein BLOT_004891 [Blomia tropicalis]
MNKSVPKAFFGSKPPKEPQQICITYYMNTNFSSRDIVRILNEYRIDWSTPHRNYFYPINLKSSGIIRNSLPNPGRKFRNAGSNRWVFWSGTLYAKACCTISVPFSVYVTV